MYTVKQNKNFISTTFQEKNHSLNLEKKYMQHWYYNIIFTWISWRIFYIVNLFKINFEQYFFEPIHVHCWQKNIFEFKLLKLHYINYKYMSYNTLKWISYFQIVDYKYRGKCIYQTDQHVEMITCKILIHLSII